MSFKKWEQDVELFVPTSGGLMPVIDRPFDELPLDPDTLPVDITINYLSTNERQVRMTVLGFVAAGPLVETTINTAGKLEQRAPGILLGCENPKEGKTFPGVLRKRHQPQIVTEEKLRYSLPMSISLLRLAYL